MPEDVKLVALDIDGTLLAPGVPHNAVPDDTVVGAVKALQARGIVVMLATGRMYPGTAPIANHLGIKNRLSVSKVPPFITLMVNCVMRTQSIKTSLQSFMTLLLAMDIVWLGLIMSATWLPACHLRRNFLLQYPV